MRGAELKVSLGLSHCTSTIVEPLGGAALGECDDALALAWQDIVKFTGVNPAAIPFPGWRAATNVRMIKRLRVTKSPELDRRRLRQARA